MENKQITVFESAPVWKAIAQMALPAMVIMVVMTLYNLADTFFIAKTGIPAMITGISLASPLFMILSAIGVIVGQGGAAAIGKALGAKHEEEVKSLSAGSFLLSIVSGLLFAFVIFLAKEPILTFLGTDEATRLYTSQYITILAAGAPAAVFSQAFSNIIRSEGAVKESMMATTLGTITNMILDPLFISVFGLGVIGAAIATVLGNIVASIVLLVYLLKKKSMLSISSAYALSHLTVLPTLLAVGLPGGLGNLLQSASGTVGNRIGMTYGADTVAAIGVGGKASLIIAMLVMGVTMGVQPLISYNVGARNKARTNEILKKTGLLATVIAIGLTIACYFGRSGLIGLFLKDVELVALSEKVMLIHLVSMPALGLFYLGQTYLQAATESKAATILAAGRQFLFLIPSYFLLNLLFGLNGFLFAGAVTDILSTILAVILMTKSLTRKSQAFSYSYFSISPRCTKASASPSFSTSPQI